VGDEDTAVAGALHGAEDAGAGGCSAEADVEVALEGAGCVLVVELFGELEGAVGLGDTLVFVGETELCESTAGAEEAGCVCWRNISIE
jgi:hypothetical protein